MRHLFQLITISRKNLRLGNKADIRPVMIHNRQIPRLRLLELVHHTVHLLVYIYIGRSGKHEIIHMHLIIPIRMEHILTDILKRHIAMEMIPVIDDREDISL